MTAEEHAYYSADFFSSLSKVAHSSAIIVVPLITELVQPESVVDVGCGTGEWLAVFREKGVEDVVGIDGTYVDRRLLKIPEERFVSADLAQPLHLERTFDLVVSLEVAEHLPPGSADNFVDSLTKLGPIVLFSAAIPLQGGTEHVNEQWPEYWANLFSEKGYVVVDALRSKVWHEERVAFYYAQNTLLFVAQDRLENYPLLRKGHPLPSSSMLSIVHPKLYLEKAEKATYYYFLIERPKWQLTLKAKSILPDKIYRLVRSVYRRLRSASF